MVFETRVKDQFCIGASYSLVDNSFRYRFFRSLWPGERISVSIYKVMRYFFVVIAVVATLARAATVEEYQSVRLSKAEIAVADGNTEVALQLLRANLKPAYPLHLPSLILLLQISLGKGTIKEASQVYDGFMKKLPVSSEKGLGLRQQIGLAYLRAFEEKSGQDEGRILLDYAERYLRVCDRHGYDLAATKLYLGKILAAQGRASGALKYFAESKELFKKELGLSSEEGLEEIDYLIAKTLVQNGFFDSANIYFRSIYTSRSTPKSLQNVAAEYLKALNTDYLSLSTGYSFHHSSNVHDLSDEEFRGLDDGDSSKSGFYHRYHAGAFGNVGSVDRGMGAFFILDFSGEDYVEEEHRGHNMRTLSLISKFKYDIFKQSLIQLKYSLYKTFYKPSIPGSYKTYSTTHMIEPWLTHNIQSGVLGGHLYFTLNDYDRGYEDVLSGIGLSYTPFLKHRYFSPSYSLKYTRNRSSYRQFDSHSVSASVTNTMTYSDKLSFFPTASIVRERNKEESYDYKYAYLLLHMNYLPQFFNIKSLSLFYSVDYSYREDGSRERVESITSALGANYYF